MKHYKKIMALIYGALLVICIGIVWFLGMMNHHENTGENRETTAEEGSSQAEEKKENNKHKNR